MPTPSRDGKKMWDDLVTFEIIKLGEKPKQK